MTMTSTRARRIAEGAFLYGCVMNLTITELQDAEDWIDPASGETLAAWRAWETTNPKLVNAAKQVQNEAFNLALSME